MMKIFKKMMDFIYGTARVRRKYLAEHPDEIVVAADASKGIITKGHKDIRRGVDWVTSQRAVIVLSDKRIKCGQWDIPLDQITTSELVKINTTFGPGQVLKVSTKDQQDFQFGMQMNSEWTEQTVLPLTLAEGKLKYSWFSIATRLIVLGYLVYWIIEKLAS